jgi:hypothetical protein
MTIDLLIIIRRFLIFPLLGILLGFILKCELSDFENQYGHILITLDQADFVFQYISVKNTTTSIYAGIPTLAEVASSVGSVDTYLVCLYILAWTSSLLSVNKYATGSSPIYCVKDCTTYFLSGGLETARAVGGNLNQTILQGDFFGNTDSILVYGAPGVGLEFWQPEISFQFNQSTDCKLYAGYNQTDGDALQLCIASYNSNLVIGKRCWNISLSFSVLNIKGWTVCPTAVFQHNACANDTGWAESINYQTILAVYRQNATTAYSRQNLSILHVETTSPPYNYGVTVSLFWSIWDKTFSPASVLTPNDSMMQNAMLLSLNWYLRLFQDRYQNDRETPLEFLQNFISVPIQFSSTALQIANATLQGENITNIFPIPPELEVTASGARVITRFKGQVWTFVLFVTIGGSLVLYCGLILSWILWEKAPLLFNPSSFPTIDFASLSGVQTQEGKQTIANLVQNGSLTTREIAKAAAGKYLHIEREPDSHLVMELNDSRSSRVG